MEKYEKNRSISLSFPSTKEGFFSSKKAFPKRILFRTKEFLRIIFSKKNINSAAGFQPNDWIGTHCGVGKPAKITKNKWKDKEDKNEFRNDQTKTSENEGKQTLMKKDYRWNFLLHNNCIMIFFSFLLPFPPSSQE